MHKAKEPLPNPITHPHLKDVRDSWILDFRYLCYLSVTDQGYHLRVRYKDKNLKDIPYSELMEIKDVILGKHAIAIMIFPRREDHIDNSHTYHLFTLTGVKLPNLKEMYSYDN